MKRPTLEDFMQDRLPNQFVWYKTIESYVRKGPIMVDGVRKNALQVATLHNHKRSHNVDFLEKPKRTGLLSEYDQLCREMAAKHGYDGVYVELVHTEFLRDVLIRYGYTLVNSQELYGICSYNYWFPVK